MTMTSVDTGPVLRERSQFIEKEKSDDDFLTGNSDPLAGSPGLHQYLKEIGRHRLLNKQETGELVRRYHEDHDKSAGTELILANLRLVVKVVSDFQKYWMNNFLDLIQEGNVGLTRAVEKFDPSRGVKFSSYAAYWIRAHVLKFIMDNWRLVKIGTTQAQRKLFFKLNREKKLLEAQGIKPHSQLLSERLDVKETEVIEMGKRMGNSEVSLEAPVRPGSNDEQKLFLACDSPSVEDIVASKDFKERLHQIIDEQRASLSDRERVILFERLLDDEGRTLNDIAGQFSISRERVRQIEIGLLRKLKGAIETGMTR